MAGNGAAALGHYNTQKEAGLSAPYLVNGETEVHLDVTVSSQRSARVVAVVPFVPKPGIARSSSTPISRLCHQRLHRPVGRVCRFTYKNSIARTSRIEHPPSRQSGPYYPDWVERKRIDLDGLVNLRDVGGIPTIDGGKIIPGRLLRSDNLQTLTNSDIDQLLGLGLTDVVDLRRDYEAEQEGPTLLATSGVRIHQFSLFREWQIGVGEPKPDVRPEVMPEEALPWVDLEPSAQLDNDVASVYFLLPGGPT